MDWQAIHLSIRLAFLTTIILLILGIPVGYWLSVSRSKLKFFVEAIVALPLVLPPTVLGFYILMVMSPQGYLGHFYEKWTGRLLPFSFEGLLLGSILYSFPFAVQPFFSAFSNVDRRLIEASWCLGTSRIKTFFRITLPLCLPGIITGAILTFTHTLGEFGVVLMIGGNIRGVTRTISISIFDEVQSMNYSSAGMTSLFLLIISFLMLVVIGQLRKRILKYDHPTLD